jgi:hypothetical protein
MKKFQFPSSKTKFSERHAFFLRSAFFSLPTHGIGNSGIGKEKKLIEEIGGNYLQI